MGNTKRIPASQLAEHNSQRLSRLAQGYVAEQTLMKCKGGVFGRVTVELIFRDGELTEVQLHDFTTVRVENLTKRAAKPTDN